MQMSVKCCICGKESSLYLTIRDKEKELGYYCPEFGCCQKALNRIGTLRDWVAMKKAT